MNTQLSSHIKTPEMSEQGQLDIDFENQFQEELLHQPQSNFDNQRSNKSYEPHLTTETKFKNRKLIKVSPEYEKFVPKFSEYRRCLQTLKQVAPEMFDDQFVDKFYIKVYQKISSLNSNNKRSQNSKKPIAKKPKYPPTNAPTQLPAKTYLPADHRSMGSHSYKNAKFQQQKRCIQNELQMQNVQAQTLKLEEAGQNGQMINEKSLIELVKIVASVFCEKGYNVEAIEQLIALKNLSVRKSQINFYKIVSHIVYNAYEFLYKFLVEQCSKQVLPLAQSFGEQFLISYLINCSKNIQAQTCQIFYKIIKGQCSLGSQQLSPDNALNLYNQIQRKMTALRRKQRYLKVKKQTMTNDDMSTHKQSNRPYDPRRINRRMLNVIERAPHPKQIDQVNKLNRVWNSRYQSEMIAYYKQGRTISQITDDFKHIFPKDKDAFSSVAIRSQLYKILRKSLKKFYTLINKYGSKRLPEVKKLNHYEVRAIIYNNDGIEVRIRLLDIYLVQNYEERLIIDTIKEIIKYVSHLQMTQKLASNYSLFTQQRAQKMSTKGKVFPYNPRNLTF